jgi:hypothetical protein
VVWDERLIPDIRAFLEERLGSLVELEVAEPHDHASDQRVEVQIPVFHGGIVPDELVAVVHTVRRGAGLTLDDVAAQMGMSRPTLSNALLGRHPLSPDKADCFVAWIAQPPPIRQMPLL